MNHVSRKSKRILILGIAVVGVVFLNKTLVNNQSDSREGFAVQPLSRGFSLVESGVQYEFYKDKFKSYLEPNKFNNFEYKNNDLEFNGECSDLYYTILIYSKEIDYRINPASAKFNQAFECPKSKKFNFTVDQNTGLSEGKYYIIFADQGKEGGWYDPR